MHVSNIHFKVILSQDFDFSYFTKAHLSWVPVNPSSAILILFKSFLRSHLFTCTVTLYSVCTVHVYTRHSAYAVYSLQSIFLRILELKDCYWHCLDMYSDV
jgi:hypothetical protein